MIVAEQTANKLYFLEGGGEMGELMRAKDWSKTPLGDPEQWPPSLKTMVAVMLNSPFGMYITWGEDYIQLYNDAYRPVLGSTKHPEALGISTRETFREIWPTIGPMFQDVMNGKAVGFVDFMFLLNRNGYEEECYFDFSYSPITMENGKVGGIVVPVIETTNKKKAELALKQSEEQFRAMADNIPNLAWMADANGYIFWYNKRWHEYTGTTPAEMEGWGWQSVHDPSVLPDVLNKWKASIATGEPFEMTFPIKGADGKFRQFLTRVVPVFNEESKITKWFGSNTDITSQIEAEQAVKESEQRFRTMAEGTDIYIAVGDESSKAIYFNHAWTELTGRPMEDLIEFGWLDLVHPEDRDRYLNIYLDAFKKREPFSGEFRVLNRKGEYRWLLAKGPPRFNEDGSFAGYISSCVDITEHKLVEKALETKERNLRSVIVQAPVAMSLLRGPNFVVELANDLMIELWGKSHEELDNKPVFEGLSEAKNQGFEELLTGVYETGIPYSAQGVPINLPRNGKIETVYVNFVYEAYREADDKVTGILVVAVDVTTQVIAHQRIEEVVAERTRELAEANTNLEKSNAELAQFAYIASHDLQEPLRKISNFTNILENSLDGNVDEARRYLKKITESSLRMNRLIKDVLSYSELVKDTKVMQPVDLNTVLKAVLEDYDLLLEQKGATVRADKLPTINAIPVQMSQLFGNLIGNALKFSRSEVPPMISITVSDSTSEELEYSSLDPTLDYYTIQFRDNGIGFKEEHGEQIFAIFQRLHRKSQYQGTGIGLAMCKKIVLNHLGDINAKGSSENGAVFNIILPKSVS